LAPIPRGDHEMMRLLDRTGEFKDS
jgi:hypothetical protein